jgi:hypothetical protein
MNRLAAGTLRCSGRGGGVGISASVRTVERCPDISCPTADTALELLAAGIQFRAGGFDLLVEAHTALLSTSHEVLLEETQFRRDSSRTFGGPVHQSQASIERFFVERQGLDDGWFGGFAVCGSWGAPGFVGSFGYRHMTNWLVVLDATAQTIACFGGLRNGMPVRI